MSDAGRGLLENGQTCAPHGRYTPVQIHVAITFICKTISNTFNFITLENFPSISHTLTAPGKLLLMEDTEVRDTTLPHTVLTPWAVSVTITLYWILNLHWFKLKDVIYQFILLLIHFKIHITRYVRRGRTPVRSATAGVCGTKRPRTEIIITFREMWYWSGVWRDAAQV